MKSSALMAICEDFLDSLCTCLCEDCEAEYYESDTGYRSCITDGDLGLAKCPCNDTYHEWKDFVDFTVKPYFSQYGR